MKHHSIQLHFDMHIKISFTDRNLKAKNCIAVMSSHKIFFLNLSVIPVDTLQQNYDVLSP